LRTRLIAALEALLVQPPA